MKYEVTIEARITKSYIVEADDTEEAVHIAHSKFNVNDDGTPEVYEQELMGICGIEEADHVLD